jgi:hypothetical protein
MVLLNQQVKPNCYITYLIQINGNVNIDLIIISPKPEVIITAITREKLKTVIEKIESLNLFFGVDKVQFILSENNEWEFNYALTSIGEAIGTEKSFNKRDKMFKELAAKMVEQAKQELNEGGNGQDVQPI